VVSDGQCNGSNSSDDKTGRLCVDAAYEVLSDEHGRIGVAHAGFAMTALPHKRITDAVWERDGGQIKLLVESGLDIRKQPIGIARQLGWPVSDSKDVRSLRMRKMG
jgi:hypothetical protein